MVRRSIHIEPIDEFWLSSSMLSSHHEQNPPINFENPQLELHQTLTTTQHLFRETEAAPSHLLAQLLYPELLHILVHGHHHRASAAAGHATKHADDPGCGNGVEPGGGLVLEQQALIHWPASPAQF